MDKQKLTEDVLHVLLLRLPVSSLLRHSHAHPLRPGKHQGRCGPQYGGVLPGQLRATPGDLGISLARIEPQSLHIKSRPTFVDHIPKLMAWHESREHSCPTAMFVEMIKIGVYRVAGLPPPSSVLLGTYNIYLKDTASYDTILPSTC